MKIEFDKILPPYNYPLSAAQVKQVLAECVPGEILSKLVKIHFGCNQQTTQEARIVQRGSNFEVRINFCPKNGNTKLLSEKSKWHESIKLCGGVINKKDQNVVWSSDAARKYVSFLIAHEIAHIAYAERNGFTKLEGSKSSASEEAWCDSFARSVINKL